MAVPKYNEMYLPFLEALRDGKVHLYADVKQNVENHFHLTPTDLDELLTSGRQTVFLNRIGWTRTYLKKAGLIDSPARAQFQITPEGKKALAENPNGFDNDYLMKFDSFKQFVGLPVGDASLLPNGAASVLSADASAVETGDTPDAQFEKAFAVITSSLVDEILDEVRKISPQQFEKLATRLIEKIYGLKEGTGTITQYVGDHGIDGIVSLDRFGFNTIYMQAKHQMDKVSEPQLREFVGSMPSGRINNGVFVTTAQYTAQAVRYAKERNLYLIDGDLLARLMIEYNFGVTVKKTYEIKAMDSDFFADYRPETNE